MPRAAAICRRSTSPGVPYGRAIVGATSTTGTLTGAARRRKPRRASARARKATRAPGVWVPCSRGHDRTRRTDARTMLIRSTMRAVATLTAILTWSAACRSPDAPASAAPGAATGPRPVTALGRLEPKDGIRRIAGPSRPSVVIAKLLVEEGDQVQLGQALAELDSIAADEAAVVKAKAALKNAEADMGRMRPLVAQRIASQEALDQTQLHVDTARADLVAAQSVLELDVVRAPVAGQVLDIYARAASASVRTASSSSAQRPDVRDRRGLRDRHRRASPLGQRARSRARRLPASSTGVVERIRPEDPQAGRARHRPGRAQGRARRRGRGASRRQRARGRASPTCRSKSRSCPDPRASLRRPFRSAGCSSGISKVRFAVALAGIAFAVMLILMQLGFRASLFESAVRYHKRFALRRRDLQPRKPVHRRAAAVLRPPPLPGPRRRGRAVGEPGLHRAGELEEPRDRSRPAASSSVGHRSRGRRARRAGRRRRRDLIRLPGRRALRRPRRARSTARSPSGSRPATPSSTEVTTAASRVGGIFTHGHLVRHRRQPADERRQLPPPLPDIAPRHQIDLGLVRVADGVDPVAVRDALRALLPKDVLVAHQAPTSSRARSPTGTSATPIGFVFTFGAIIGFVVGTVIVYQILFADVSDHLAEYATLRAIGYSNGYISRVVVQQALILGRARLRPRHAGVAAALRASPSNATQLPMELTPERALMVLGRTVACARSRACSRCGACAGSTPPRSSEPDVAQRRRSRSAGSNHASARASCGSRSSSTSAPTSRAARS